MFPLPKFCSVANLQYKSHAWHVFLELLLDKTGIMKIYGIGFNFFETLRIFFTNVCFSQKLFSRFAEKGVSLEGLPTHFNRLSPSETYVFLKNYFPDLNERGVNGGTYSFLRLWHSDFFSLFDHFLKLFSRANLPNLNLRVQSKLQVA